jgi:septum site-determining protein MinC
MAVASLRNVPALFDLKSATLPLVAVVLKSVDLQDLAADLDTRLADTPDFFNHDPVVIDLSAVRDSADAVDFPALLALLKRYKMLPVAAKAGSEAQMAAALEAGLSEAPDAGPAPEAAVRDVITEVVKEVEVVREVPVTTPALIIDKPLRSGQQVYAKGCDLVVLAVVSFGAEVLADGHIHVYAPLRGRAIAGAKGNTEARIFTTCLEPELLAIAGTYRTSETPLPDDLRGKPAQVRLVGDKLVMEPLNPI